MLKRIAFPVVIILIAISLAVPVMAESKSQRAFLPAGAVDGVGLIGPPPEHGSSEFETQMDIVLWLQQTRTPDQVTFAEQPLNLERFAPMISTSLLGVDGELLSSTLDGVIDEVRMDYDAVKAVFNEPRPFQTDTRVNPVGDARPVASYPSGHAIRATVYGTLLSDMFPEHGAEISELARQVGYGRVIAGVHYPIDVTAGQKLGAAYASEIMKQPAYKDAVEAIFKNSTQS